MSKALTEIRSLARSHTRTAINALVGVMKAKDASHAARVSAATAILDRGWGTGPPLRMIIISSPIEATPNGVRCYL